MVPVGAIVGLVVIAIRALSAAGNSSGGATTPANPGVAQVSRGSSNFWSDPGAGGTVVWQLVLLGCGFGFTAGGLGANSLVLLALGFTAWWWLFPAWTASSVLAPLGFVRLAYFSASLSRVTWRRDKPGGPAMVAAWGLAQQERPWPSSIAWVENKLSHSKNALQASGVVARGLLEAAKGNHEAAREWLESVLLFDPRIAVPVVRTVAGEWLATDAAARGDWRRVKELTSSSKWPASRTMTLLGALAGRMLGEAMPTTAGLWFWWLMAPRRLWTFSFVRKAAAKKPAPRGPDLALPEAPSTLEPMARATWLLLALRTKSPAVVDVARAWESALDGELRSKLFARSALIGGGEPDDAISEVRRLLEEALAPMIPAKLGAVPGGLPSLLDAASQTRREKLNNELEDKMNRLEARKLGNKELPQLEEWHEFLTLRKLYRAACDASTNQSDYSLAHSIIRDKLVNFGVWLYNVRTEKPLANALFRMLETEAVVLGDSESERLNKKYSGCDL